jgi:hydroxymethylbilane synthase
MHHPIRIGTRGSPLALVQANDVRRRLAAAHRRPESDFEITIIKTSGDRIQDRPLAEVGGKGLFTKELEEALLADQIDLAVHSMKDVATVLPERLTIAAVLEREDVRDAFISIAHRSLAEVPKGARVGTSSLRRQAQVLRARPDLSVVGFRGNVETRLAKLEQGIAVATFLAVAGLNRLGKADRITAPIAVDDMLPAVAQGAVGIEIRADDTATRALVASLDHTATHTAVACERAFLAVLDGSCRTPIAGLATVSGATIAMKGEVVSPDGRRWHDISLSGSVNDAGSIGTEAGRALAAKLPSNFFETA